MLPRGICLYIQLIMLFVVYVHTTRFLQLACVDSCSASIVMLRISKLNIESVQDLSIFVLRSSAPPSPDRVVRARLTQVSLFATGIVNRSQ